MPAIGHPLRATSSVQDASRGWILQPLGEIRAVLGAWRQSRRYRRELERVLSSGPHLIEDIGLTLQHADRGVATPFWRKMIRAAAAGAAFLT